MSLISFIRKIIVSSSLLLLCITFCVKTIYSQDNQVYFDHITQKQGLSNNGILSILQDHKGFIWIGTEFGLNRYDGQIKSYQYPDTLPVKRILCLYEDKANNLWIGSTEGLLKYNRKTDSFSKIPLCDDTLTNITSWISSIYQDKNNILWLGTNLGLVKLDINNNQCERYLLKEKTVGTNYSPVYGVVEDTQGTLWVSTNDKLKIFDRFTNTSTDIITLDAKNAFFNIAYNNLALHPNGNLFVGSTEGLYLVNTQTKKVVSKYEQFNNEQITSLLLADSKTLYIGTFKSGLFKIDLTTNKTINYRNNPEDPNSLLGNTVFALFQDKGGVLWVGDGSYGLNKLSPYRNLFRLYQNNPFNKNSLSNNYIRGIFDDSNGFVWIATQYGGLNKLELQTGKITRYQDKIEDISLGNSLVWNIYKDSQNILWIGLFPDILAKEGQRNTDFTIINTTLDKNITTKLVYSGKVFHEDRQGTLWIGTANNLYSISKNRQVITDYKRQYSNKWVIGEDIQAIFEDSQGKIWIGTERGFLVVDTETNQNTFYTGYISGIYISDSYICSFWEDESKNIWIATKGSGVLCFNPQKNEFTVITEKDGLPHNNTYGILGDSKNTLWISSDNGLAHYDPNKKKFELFGVNDGLQGKEFNRYAFFKSSKGELFFGGTNGLNSFYPEQIIKNNVPPKVIITDFLVNGVRLDFDQNNLELNYTQKSLSIKFAAIDFNDPENNLYNYRLVGFDPNWIQSRGQKEVIYNNLEPGNYTFEVRGTNNHQIWSDKITELKFTVLPPPWRSNWSYLLYSVMLIGSISAIVSYQTNRLKIAANIKEAKLRAESAEMAAKAALLEAKAAELQTKAAQVQTESLERENQQRIKNELEIKQKNQDLEEANLKLKELDEIKAKFTAMLVHDLKSPLTVISSTLDILLEDKKDIVKSQLINTSRKSVKKIVDLVNEVLEFYRTNSEEMKLEFQPTNLLDLITYSVEGAKIAARDKNISVKFYPDSQIPLVSADANKLERVFSNLFSNALKFTPKNGKITVEVSTQKGSGVETGLTFVNISITDTGEGILPEELPYIFEPYRQAKSSQSKVGVGLGLSIVKRIIAAHSGNISVHSQIGVGSCFTITLPALACLIPELSKNQENTTNISREDKQIINSDIVKDKRILLADDERINQKIILAKLKSIGYKVDIANNGKEAVEMFLSNRYDLVLMDHYMPEKDGLLASKEIRDYENKQKDNKHTPIIIITANAISEMEINYKDICIDDFIEKPFNIEKLALTVQEWLFDKEAKVLN